MSLELVLRSPPADHPGTWGGVSLAGLLPERLAESSASEVEQFPISCDGRPARLSDCFSVSGNAADGVLHCHGDFSRVHYLGAGLTRGEVVVHGDVGRHTGEGMTGGILDVSGDAGDWLACGMAGGIVRVGGNAGDNAAASLPGERQGMTGGSVTIGGSVGSLAGSRMRRGILVVGSDCGEAAGFEMLAGTVLVAGRPGKFAGLGMRRGSVILLGATEAEDVTAWLPPTFRRGAVWTPAFLPLLAQQLSSVGFATATTGNWCCPWQQWHGDTLCGGRGEILVPAARQCPVASCRRAGTKRPRRSASC
jgi:formylmethanofuran dehydrogenase subunit C